MSSAANGDMVRIIPIAVLAIAILLGLVLRSLVAPVYLVVSIVASYLAALGLTTLLAIDLGGQDGLVFILPFLMFVFLLALGEDYNILVMTRIREEARTASAAGGGGRGHRPDRADGHLGRADPGRHVRRVRGGGRRGHGRPAAADRARPGTGHAAGHVRRPDAAGAVAWSLLGRWNWWPSRMSQPGSGLGRGPEPASAAGSPVASDNTR